MIVKYRALLAFCLIFGALLPVNDPAVAFELFPRPISQYTVQRGDTLYGIAGLYYHNPALWQILWNHNPQVKIDNRSKAPQNEPLTPGMKLNIFDKRFPFTVMNRTYKAPTGVPDAVSFLVSRIPFAGIPYDKKYFRFKLGVRPTRVWGYIVGSPEVDKFSYLERDTVYIRVRPSKRQAILIGDRLGVYRERGPLFHPIDRERIVGYQAEIVGEVEVISTGNALITAIILDSYVELGRGDKVSVFTPRSREIVPTKTHKMLTGTILRSASRQTYYLEAHNLENDVVFLNRGAKDGMEQGTLVNIYRPNHPVQDPYTMRRVPLPDRYIGEGMVLKPFKHNSTLLITRSREEVVAGDIVKSVSD